jgi:glycine betaine/choline ABC-type transport system substrate-binding protein
MDGAQTGHPPQEVPVKKLFALLSVLIVMAVAQHSVACVGKTLYVGITGSSQEVILAEIISQLVTERTGTTVKVLQFKDSTELYNAVKKGEVGVLVENTDRALRILDRKESNPKQAYELAKKEYRKNFNLVWLESFGTSQAYAPVISLDTIGHLPALPKLLNKLGGVLNEDSYSRLLKSMKSDEKPRRIARDFLKSRKLI